MDNYINLFKKENKNINKDKNKNINQNTNDVKNNMTQNYKNKIDELIIDFKNRNNLNNIEPIEIDLIMSTGGFAGYYLSGLCYFLIKSGLFNIIRYSGASAGAIASAMTICDVDLDEYINYYKIVKQKYDEGKPILEIYKEYFEKTIPENAHELCNNRLNVSLFTLENFIFLKNIKKNKFETRNDLINMVLASGAIPFITMKTLSYNYKNNVYFDGIKPFTFDDNLRPTLYVNLTYINYDLEYVLKPNDSDINKLVDRGIYDLIEFLEGNHKKSLSWLNVNEYNNFMKINSYNNLNKIIMNSKNNKRNIEFNIFFFLFKLIRLLLKISNLI